MTFNELASELSKDMHNLRCAYPDMFIKVGKSSPLFEINISLSALEFSKAMDKAAMAIANLGVPIPRAREESCKHVP